MARLTLGGVSILWAVQHCISAWLLHVCLCPNPWPHKHAAKLLQQALVQGGASLSSSSARATRAVPPPEKMAQQCRETAGQSQTVEVKGPGRPQRGFAGHGASWTPCLP